MAKEAPSAKQTRQDTEAQTMKVGISAIITPQEWSFTELLDQCRRLGYEAVELVIRNTGELTPDTPCARLGEMAREAAAAGVELSSVALLCRPGVDIMSNDWETRKASMDLILRGLRVTQGLGVDTMLVTPGRIGADCHYDDAYYNALSTLRKLAPEVAKTGVSVAMEYVWNWFLVSPLEYRRFLDEVDCPSIGFFFDTGNMAIQGFPEQWLKIIGRHLKKVHFKDFRRRDSAWLPLGEGDVDFAAVMAELRRIGYDGALLSEVDAGTAPFEDTAEAIRSIMGA
jgi:L-ribulose-5-phosphate 3-epimerase